MKRFVDILTVLLLMAAFGMAFYTGFIGQDGHGKPMLATNLFCIISMAGVVMLYVVGALSSLIARGKRDLITKTSLVFAVLQFFSVVGICVIMTLLWTGMFGLDNTIIRVLYIVFILICIVCYVEALMFADNLAKREAEENAIKDAKKAARAAEKAAEAAEAAEDASDAVKALESGDDDNSSFMGF